MNTRRDFLSSLAAIVACTPLGALAASMKPKPELMDYQKVVLKRLVTPRFSADVDELAVWHLNLDEYKRFISVKPIQLGNEARYYPYHEEFLEEEGLEFARPFASYDEEINKEWLAIRTDVEPVTRDIDIGDFCTRHLEALYDAALDWMNRHDHGKWKTITEITVCSGNYDPNDILKPGEPREPWVDGYAFLHIGKQTGEEGRAAVCEHQHARFEKHCHEMLSEIPNLYVDTPADRIALDI